MSDTVRQQNQKLFADRALQEYELPLKYSAPILTVKKGDTPKTGLTANEVFAAASEAAARRQMYSIHPYRRTKASRRIP